MMGYHPSYGTPEPCDCERNVYENEKIAGLVIGNCYLMLFFELQRFCAGNCTGTNKA